MRKFLFFVMSCFLVLSVSCQLLGSGGADGDPAPGGGSGGSGHGSASGSGVEPGTGDGRGAANYSNSVEITASGADVSGAAGKTLYTITVHYPDGEYTGQGTARYSLTGSGNAGRARSEDSLLSKAPPQQEGVLWNDMWDHVSIAQNPDAETTGKYWFTDETNKVKFYVTNGAVRQIEFTDAETGGKIYRNVKPAYQGILNTLNDAYWNNLKNQLQSHAVFSRNILKAERDAFGLSAYDKDGSGYFYVIFCDFGEGSADSGGGTAGVYTSAHIRNGEETNGADIFYVNARFVEATAKNGVADVDEVVATLLHEYMHYLMDVYHLKRMEEIDPVVSQGYYTSGPQEAISKARYFAAGNWGSGFWIEGTANYAPYRIAGYADTSGVRQWLQVQGRWRPPVNDTDVAAEVGNSYAVYGAGGMFFSYIAERYGSDVINDFHKYSDDPEDMMEALNNSTDTNDYRNYTGNINRVTKAVMNREFKDVYVEFLKQMMSNLNSDSTMAGCLTKSQAMEDWGISKSLMSGAAKAVAGSTTSGNLPQLSFEIHKWNQIPQRIALSGDTSKIKSYAIWF